MFRKLNLIIGLLVVLGVSPAFAAINITGEPASGISVNGSHVTITQSGSYWLTDNSTGDITIGSSGNTTIEVTLNLNGFTLSNSSPSSYPSLIDNYAILTLIDSSEGQTGTIDGKEKYLDSRSGRGIYNRGTLYFKSGAIQNCYSTRAGGGISNLKGATAYMQGGTIKDCRVDSSKGASGDISTLGGGGVYNAGTFYFESGTIKNCVAKSHANCTNKHLGGGGIYNHGGDGTHAGLLYMSGGTIENCTASRSSDYSGAGSRAHGGGGVLNVGTGASTLPTDRGVFEMTGGTIKGCNVTQYLRGCGGGVFNAEGTFYLKNGTIGGESDADGNSVPAQGSSYGGGICSRGEYFTDRTSDSPKSKETNAYFEMTGGTVAYNKSPRYAGGGICLNYGSAVITGGLITHNTAGALGGGIIGGNATNVTFGGTAVVSYNKVTDALGYTSDLDCGGGGIAVGKASGNNVFTMTGGTVIYNTCDGNGGGIYLRNVESSGQTNDVRIEGGLIAYNESGTAHNESYAAGGGIYTNGNVTITGGEISNNTSYTKGGGLFMGAASRSLEMSGGVVKENTARLEGGGIYITGGSTLEKVEFKGGEFNSNTSNKNGGGFYLAKGSVTINSNVNEFKVISNHAVNTNDGGYGGGFYVNNGNLSIESTSSNIQISGNSSDLDGAGFYMKNGTLTINEASKEIQIKANIATNNGGGFYSAGGNISISGAEISVNHAKRGAGFYVEGTNDVTTTIQGGSTISDNIATEDGGGAYIASGNLSILYSDIKDNEASTGDGGGVYVASSSTSIIKINSGNISENISTSGNGGGFFLGDGASITLENGSIEGNSASNGGAIYLSGGAFFEYKTSATGTPGFIRGNTASNLGGGIYLAQGTTSKKTEMKFTLNSTNLGFYDNTAEVGADDIYAYGGGTTTINIPNVQSMNLGGYSIPGATLEWWEDYEVDDTRYSEGTMQGDASNITRYRASRDADLPIWKVPKLSTTPLSTFKEKYLCLTLGFEYGKIEIRRAGLKPNENAIYEVKFGDGSQRDIQRVVVYGSDEEGIDVENKHWNVAKLNFLPKGEYTVTEIPWTWYNEHKEASALSKTQTISEGDGYIFNFENSHHDLTKTPLHDEEFKVNVLKK